jgi:SynChlorMet cassette radical SAM/SPASM protein ScmE
MSIKVLSAPEQVTLNITNRCNLACRYCAVSSTKNLPGDLTTGEWSAVIDELARIKVFRVLISGGEPFLRKDFLEILRCITRYPLRIAVNTNATCIDEGVLDHLARSKRLNYMQVSLDGPDAAVHDRVRGAGSFERMRRGIDLLRRHRIDYHFFVVVHRFNFQHLEEIVRFTREVGGRRAVFSCLVPQGSALQHLNDLMLSFDEQKQAEAVLRRLKREDPGRVGGSLLQGIEWMDRLQQFSRDKQPPRIANRITSCGGSLSECAIRPDGAVIPCDRLWEFTVGNVKEHGFQEIWRNSEGFRKFRERFQQRMDSFKECRGCRFADVCRGGCPATAFGLGGSINGWDPLSCFQVFSGQKASPMTRWARR